ncbi:WD repeat-containing protein 74 [Episyrphus balteatus]|uniref:WD repeat-containing protein 74 n=1 Tax=Episyrphus balteatus TaxID=286459 RepID=UPI002485B6BF|nr:WD repeat-containing protein 74 [Episyrphus balteatus]
MKWTTANLKNPNYSENHEIYVGTHTGSFKKITVANEDKPFLQQNLQEISKLDKDSRVTALGFGNEDKSEVLIGRANKFVQVYSLDTQMAQTNLEMLDAPVVGICRYDTQLIAGFGTGKIQKLQIAEDMVLSAGDNIAHLRQCEVERKLVATGGKGRQNNLKVFDMDAGKQVFSSKNLPNDFLELEVPVWDSDVGFIDANTIATCSRHGYVRLYDTRAQRRPVQKYATEDQMSFATLVARDHYIYTGTTMGAMKAFDTRRMKNFVHTYKGFTGSISDVHLDQSGKFLVSSCLDRYVRVHHTDSCVMMYQCYVKSKATRVLIRNAVGKEKTDDDVVLVGVENGEEEEDDDDVDEKPQEKDDEYDEIFNSMPTVGDKDSDDEEQKEKSTVKRKAEGKNRKNKKKKKNV